jgi:hypothetical protein
MAGRLPGSGRGPPISVEGEAVAGQDTVSQSVVRDLVVCSWQQDQIIALIDRRYHTEADSQNDDASKDRDMPLSPLSSALRQGGPLDALSIRYRAHEILSSSNTLGKL